MDRTCIGAEWLYGELPPSLLQRMEWCSGEKRMRDTYRPTLDEINPLKGETIAERMRNLADELLKFRVDIEDALRYAHGSYTYDDVVGRIISGRFQIYTYGRSFAICELQNSPQYVIYHAFLVGGDLEELLLMHEAIEPFAKEQGAKFATMNGRSGWIKPLKSLGWEPRYTVLYKEIDNG